MTGTPARALIVEAGAVRGVKTSTGRNDARAVVIATGGMARPKLGGGSGGFDLARSAGHSIVAPVPALVPLVTREDWVRELAGVSLPETRVWIDLPRLKKRATVGADAVEDLRQDQTVYDVAADLHVFNAWVDRVLRADRMTHGQFL